MDNRFLQIYLNPYFVLINLLLIVGAIFFIKLPKEKRANIYFWLPFLILSFTVLYEDFAGFLRYYYEINQRVNILFGNEENPNYNLWYYNIFHKYFTTILYLIFIRTCLEPTKRKFINGMILLYVVAVISLTFTGIEPIYLNQPIIFAIGANMILVGSGLFFIGLISNDKYLDKNPLRLLSFWQMTSILFTYSLTYISSVSLAYLLSINEQLGMSLFQIDWVMSVLNLTIFVLKIASPNFPSLFEKEPVFDSNKSMGIQSSL